MGADRFDRQPNLLRQRYAGTNAVSRTILAAFSWKACYQF